MERWKWKTLCNEAPFRFKKKKKTISPPFEPETQFWAYPASIGREKRRGAVEDVDSSALAQILEIISSRCALYVSIILEKPDVHPIFGDKKLFKNITCQILNFILES